MHAIDHCDLSGKIREKPMGRRAQLIKAVRGQAAGILARKGKPHRVKGVELMARALTVQIWDEAHPDDGSVDERQIKSLVGQARQRRFRKADLTEAVMARAFDLTSSALKGKSFEDGEPHEIMAVELLARSVAFHVVAQGALEVAQDVINEWDDGDFDWNETFVKHFKMPKDTKPILSRRATDALASAVAAQLFKRSGGFDLEGLKEQATAEHISSC